MEITFFGKSFIYWVIAIICLYFLWPDNFIKIFSAVYALILVIISFLIYLIIFKNHLK